MHLHKDRSDARAASSTTEQSASPGTAPAPSRPHALLHTLHHTAGNAAVAQMLTVQRAPTVRDAATAEQMIEALEASGHSGDDAYGLMGHLTREAFPPGPGQSPFDMNDHIKSAGQARIAPIKARQSAQLLGKKWTIRHYSGTDRNRPPLFTDIASTYDNALAGRISSHTNMADWRSLGNIKFTFYLVAIDGRVPKRPFLNDVHWYAEWNLDDIRDCWFSRDLLGSMSKAKDAGEAQSALADVRAFRGSGTEIKKILAASVFGAGNDPAEALDNVVGGAFELKVPGGLPVTRWERKT